MEKQHKRTILSALFLVAGTCIGGGMLALPIITGISGFFPSIFIMFICWFIMTSTALLLLEASLWFGEGAHVITMTSHILGPIGKWTSWILYLFICYASLVAYTAGGGSQMASVVQYYFNLPMTKDIGCIAFATLFTAVIFVGSWFVGRVNSILFIAMIGAYFALVGMGIDEVKPELLMHSNWKTSFAAVPLLLTSFSFQTMVPSLTPYLKRNVRGLRIAIIGGTILAFVIYAIWQWLILGIVPVDGDQGLVDALAQGNLPATEFLREHVQGRWISSIAEFFAYFAIVTSFLGIALGLFDFLADGLKISNKAILALLVVVPTVLFATQFERAFMTAMDASGGFGDTLLNGLIPILLIWKGRYWMGYKNSFKVWGGKPFLIVLAVLFSSALVIEILGIAGYIPSIYDSSVLVEIHNLRDASSD